VLTDIRALADYFSLILSCAYLVSTIYYRASTHDVGHSIGEARFGFNPTASSHFHVIEYVDVDAVCTGVTTTKRIYSNAPFFRGSSILSCPYKWCPNEPPL
jgi:hypothetical protein